MISEITTLDEPATVAEIETIDEPATAETTDEPATVSEIETTDEPATAETTDEPATAETTDEPTTDDETTDEEITTFEEDMGGVANLMLDSLGFKVISVDNEEGTRFTAAIEIIEGDPLEAADLV